jgi:hypothetical protein
MVPPSLTDPPNEVFLKEDMRKEWSNGMKHFFELFWISSPSTIIPCSIRGIAMEAQIIPVMEANIMPWHLAYTLLGSVPLKPSDKLFKSCPLGHILECRGVGSAMPITINKIEHNLVLGILKTMNKSVSARIPS